MHSQCEARRAGSDTWEPAILSDEHAASSYGLPVVLIDGNPFGTAEVEAIRVSSADQCDVDLLDAAIGAGFFVLGMPRGSAL